VTRDDAEISISARPLQEAENPNTLAFKALYPPKKNRITVALGCFKIHGVTPQIDIADRSDTWRTREASTSSEAQVLIGLDGRQYSAITYQNFTALIAYQTLTLLVVFCHASKMSFLQHARLAPMSIAGDLR